MMVRYDPHRHHRRSIRLQGYDYAQPGMYFVTIVTQGRECLFGDVVDGEMHLNDVGRMIEGWWMEVGRKFPHVMSDTYVVMPNHFHAIIAIGADVQVGEDHSVGADLRVCPSPHQGEHIGLPLQETSQPKASVPRIVQWFKTMTTHAYIRAVKSEGWTPFQQRLWQRNYFERIVRDEPSLDRIREYILGNPSMWQEDVLNPRNASEGGDIPSEDVPW